MATRGSSKMLAKQDAGPAPVSRSDLVKLQAIARMRGVKLINWLDHGQPVPDAIEGTFQIAPGPAAGVIAELMRLRRLRLGYEIFPYGIPEVEGYIVNFRRAGGGSLP